MVAARQASQAEVEAAEAQEEWEYQTALLNSERMHAVEEQGRAAVREYKAAVDAMHEDSDSDSDSDSNCDSTTADPGHVSQRTSHNHIKHHVIIHTLHARVTAATSAAYAASAAATPRFHVLLLRTATCRPQHGIHSAFAGRRCRCHSMMRVVGACLPQPQGARRP